LIGIYTGHFQSSYAALRDKILLRNTFIVIPSLTARCKDSEALLCVDAVWYRCS